MNQEEMQREIAQLRAWKESMMAVESGWSEQRVAKVLGLPIGTNIRPAIEPAIRALIEEHSTVSKSLIAEQALREQMRRALEDALEYGTNMPPGPREQGEAALALTAGDALPQPARCPHCGKRVSTYLLDGKIRLNRHVAPAGRLCKGSGEVLP